MRTPAPSPHARAQGKKFLLMFLLLCTLQKCAQSDFLDDMGREFFGGSSSNNDHRQQPYPATPSPFSQMFGSPNQPVPQRQPHSQNYPTSHQPQRFAPQRPVQYAPANAPHQQPNVLHQQQSVPHQLVSYPHQQPHPPYNGPPAVYGQQHGYGQRRPDSNETKTDGYPSDGERHVRVHGVHQYQQVEYQHVPVHHHDEAAVVVEHNKPHGIEYQAPGHHHVPHQVEYHHIPEHKPEVAQHHAPTIEILPVAEHGYHEPPPSHVEYHHPPAVEYHHHYPTHKPKRFSLSLNQPSPDWKVVDKHLKLPPVKFRFHFNPKIVITSNTKDPLDKKHHHDEEHDLEPYPPPDVFSDPDAVPQFNRHVVEHYPVEHHYATEHVVADPHHKHAYPVEHHVVADPHHKHAYPVEHHVVADPHHKHAYPEEHHVVAVPQAKHAYPADHQVAGHYPNSPEYVYDLSRGHSHLNLHHKHYEPTFKVRMKPIIFTEPPPTRPTTTTTTARPTMSTARTTTTRRTTRSTTTRRPRTTRRTTTTTRASTTTTTTTTTRATTTTTPRTTAASTTVGTTRARINARNPGFSVAFTEGSTTSTTTSPTSTRRSVLSTSSEREKENGRGISVRRDDPPTSAETTISAMTMTSEPTTSRVTSTTTAKSTTDLSTASTSLQTTSQRPATTQRPESNISATSTTTTTTTPKPTARPTPAEETTRRTTTLSADANEIDTSRVTSVPSRRRPEPLQDVSSSSSSVERSEAFSLESSDSVKVVETTMLIDGKNQTVRFYYITQPVKLPLDLFRKMTGQSETTASGVNVIKIRRRRSPGDVLRLFAR